MTQRRQQRRSVEVADGHGHQVILIPPAAVGQAACPGRTEATVAVAAGGTSGAVRRPAAVGQAACPGRAEATVAVAAGGTSGAVRRPAAAGQAACPGRAEATVAVAAGGTSGAGRRPAAVGQAACPGRAEATVAVAAGGDDPLMSIFLRLAGRQARGSGSLQRRGFTKPGRSSTRGGQGVLLGPGYP